MAGNGQMVMAGLWDRWKEPVLTCPPNDAVAALQSRMPVILAETDWPTWLGENPATENELMTLLRPCPDDALKMWPVDKTVGNVKNTGPQLSLNFILVRFRGKLF